MKTTNKLRAMNRERALAYCANLTAPEWSKMDDDLTIELWVVFRDYIDNGFNGTTVPIPDRIADIWDRCKSIIDKEAGI